MVAILFCGLMQTQFFMAWVSPWIRGWQKNPGKDAYWALNDPFFQYWCQGMDPTKMETLASCLNGGVFIMRKTDWMTKKLWEWLEFSRHTKDNACTTKDLNPSQFDQCMFTGVSAQLEQSHVGDQCVVGCDVKRAPATIAHYASYGHDAVPRFQALLPAWKMFPRWFFSSWNHPEYLEKTTYVVNCAGRMSFDQTLQCVAYLVNDSAKLWNRITTK